MRLYECKNPGGQIVTVQSTPRKRLCERLLMADSIYVASLFTLQEYRAELNVPDKQGSYQYTVVLSSTQGRDNV